MLLDWFTIFAQLLNFFILLVLLKIFLYGPIVNAMKERKERVAAEMSELGKVRLGAEELKADLARQQEELDNRASEVMAEIHAEADKWRRQAMESARAEIETMRDEWFAALDREKDAVALNIRKRLMHEVTSTASRMVKELADSDLETQMVAGFMRKIETEARAVDCGEGEILVRTGFNTSGEHDSRIRLMLDEFFPVRNERIISHDERLGLGIELIAGDRKWEWNLASYISELEENILAEISA